MPLTRYVLAMLVLAGCSSIEPATRIADAVKLAESAGWHSTTLPSTPFRLTAFVPDKLPPGPLLSVYIEGDGLAWLNSSTPSPDPTPIRPLALQLALDHPSGPAVYLARPCQYVDASQEPGCHPRWWTKLRFAEPVLASFDAAIDNLKHRFGASDIELIGYSGGGAIATLLATRRKDVHRLITVAGNLDTDYWVRHHKLTPLAGSLNPADAWRALLPIRQIHFSGEKDKIVPPQVGEAYASRFPPGQKPEVKIIPGYDHACCWTQDWPSLYPKN